jgi:hypothetical protein
MYQRLLAVTAVRGRRRWRGTRSSPRTPMWPGPWPGFDRLLRRGAGDFRTIERWCVGRPTAPWQWPAARSRSVRRQQGARPAGSTVSRRCWVATGPVVHPSYRAGRAWPAVARSGQSSSHRHEPFLNRGSSHPSGIGGLAAGAAVVAGVPSPSAGASVVGAAVGSGSSGASAFGGSSTGGLVASLTAGGCATGAGVAAPLAAGAGAAGGRVCGAAITPVTGARVSATAGIGTGGTVVSGGTTAEAEMVVEEWMTM